MPRVALTVINPGAESAIGAEWVNVSNVLSRRNDLAGFNTGFTSSYAFKTNSTGVYDHYQAVAIPAGEYTAVDAGTRYFNLELYAGKWRGVSVASTMEIYVEARDGSNVLLQTWTKNVYELVKTYKSLFRLLPANTRTLRIGWRGSSVIADDIWIEDISLALDDLAPAYDRFGFVTIDKTQCGATDTADFILNIRGTYGEFRSVANGGYIRSLYAGDLQFFSDGARTNVLEREIEYWDNLTGEISVWVKVPLITVAANTIVYWACGRNNGEGNGNSQSVWTNFVRVAHYGKNGVTFTTGPGADSSPNAKAMGYWNTTNQDAANDSAQLVDGIIGKGTSVITFGPSYTTTRSWAHFSEFDNLKSTHSISAWVKPTELSAYKCIVGKGNSPRAFSLFVTPTGEALASYHKAGVLKDVLGTSIMPTTGFTHVKSVYDGTNAKLYVNGVLEATLAIGGDLDVNTATAFIGQLTTAVYIMNGVIDEVRLTTNVDSVDRTLAEYNNQKAGSTFYTFGASSGSMAGQRTSIFMI